MRTLTLSLLLLSLASSASAAPIQFALPGDSANLSLDSTQRQNSNVIFTLFGDTVNLIPRSLATGPETYVNLHGAVLSSFPGTLDEPLTAALSLKLGKPVFDRLIGFKP